MIVCCPLQVRLLGSGSIYPFIVTGVYIFWNRLNKIRNTDPFFFKFFVKNSWLARNLEKRGYSLWKRRENCQRREIRIDFGFFVLLQGSKTLKIQFRVYKNSKTRASKFPNTLLVSKVNWRGTTRLYEELWIWYFCWLTEQWVGGLDKFVFWIADSEFSPAFSQTITPFFEVSG